MDLQKEREAFESWWEAFHNGRQIACDYVKEDNSYSVGYANAQWVSWQAKAQAVSELTDKMIVAIESEVESQLKASAIDADPFRLDGEKIWYAALEAQEPK